MYLIILNNYFVYKEYILYYYICRFSQCFKVRNNGDEQWPLGCYLKCTSHTNLPILHLSSMDTNECLHPAEETILTINLISPLEIGPFQTVWRLCTMNGIVFGGKMVFFLYISCF